MKTSACFTKSLNNSSSSNNNKDNNASWCQSNLTLCGNASFAYIMSATLQKYTTGNGAVCPSCQNQTSSEENYTSEVLSKCNGQNNCPFADMAVPQSGKGGMLTLSFFCNDTGVDEKAENITTNSPATIVTFNDSQVITSPPTPLATASGPTSENSTVSTGDGVTSKTNNKEPTSSSNGVTVPPILTDSDHFHTASIVVPVVIPVIIAVVVVAVIMYRRGKCKRRFVKCMNMHDKYSSDTGDAYGMSSRANANLTYDLNRDVDCDVDYCKIDEVRNETDSEYNHVNLEKKQAVQDTTYHHIEHFNSSPGNAEQTYNHVGDVTPQKPESSSLQPDTYSHIGAMAKPASEQLTDDSYAHINGVMTYIPEAHDINQYDCEIFKTNGGPTGGFGHQWSEVKSCKEKKFKVVGPSKVDVNNEAPVSHSYFILEKREKEA